MKLLVFSDVHLDAPFRWAGPDLARRRRSALRAAVTRICHVAEQESVDAVLCAGDLYEHEYFTPDTAQFLRASFAELARPVFLAPGNHDWFGPRSLYAQVQWSPNVSVFREDRLQPVELAEGLTLWGAAHRAPANTDGFLERFVVDRGGVNLALFHGSEQSGIIWQEAGKVPHAPFTEEQVSRCGLNHVFAGHFHTPRSGNWHTYPGNPEPLEFGETGERGAVIATVGANGEVERRRVAVSDTGVHEVDVDLTGISHAGEVRARVQAAVAGMSGLVRATLHGEVDPSADVRVTDLQDAAPHLEALVVRIGALAVAYDFASLAEEQTVRGQFIRDVMADALLDEPKRRRILVTGLRALDGRGDELEVH